MALTYLNEKQEVTIGTHCWVNPDARICVPKLITAGASGNASVALERFDLAMIKPFLGPDTRWMVYSAVMPMSAGLRTAHSRWWMHP